MLQVRRKRWAAARKVRQSQVKREQTARKQFQKKIKQEQRARFANATDGSGSGGGGGSSRPEGKLDVAFSDVVDKLNLAKIDAKGESQLEAKSANKKGCLSAAPADAAAEAWVTAHVLAKILGDGVASEIASCVGWMILDDRWTAPDGRGGWLQLGASNEECHFGGWDSSRWLWKHGWVVEESSMSDWSFLQLHMRRLRMRIAAGYRYVSC